MTRRIMRARLANWVDPAAAFLALSRESSWAIWLDAGPEAVDGRSYITIPASHVLTASVATGTVTETVISGSSSSLPGSPQFAHPAISHPATIFEVLREKLEIDADVIEDTTTNRGALEHDSFFKPKRGAKKITPQSSSARSDRFNLGWVGWLGYELAAQTSGVATATASTPDARFVYCDWVLEFDHKNATIDLLVLGGEAELAARREFIRSTLQHIQPPVITEPPVIPHESVRWRHSDFEYETLVLKCLELIRSGDAYQLCLTNNATIEGVFSPIDVYLRLRRTSPSHHGGFLLFGDVALLSSSPEVFLEVDGQGLIRSKPIKGTRPRGATPAQDKALAEELITSHKERAENLMIVDLMRNDIGKVSQLGTVQVDSLLAVESYPSVHQLVSTVSGTLAPQLTAVDAAEACFPAGSMTGAPKISAMSLLHDMEQGPRGIYSGAFGYFGIDGTANLAMVIRSIVLTLDRASIGTGGGITVGSIPREELEETWVKAAPLLSALGVAPNK